MNGVKTADRACRMKIRHNIPSMIMIKGVKLRVDYQGQPKTCSRCCKYWGSCPGDGKADKCKKAGGEEAKLSKVFKKLIKSLTKGPSKEATTSKPVVPTYIPDPDQVRFSGFPEDMNLKTFKEWLDGNSVTFLDNMCFQGKKPGTFSIETVEGDDGENCKIDFAEAEEMVTKLNGHLYQKRTITVTMTQLTTPEKVRKLPEMVTLDSSGEDVTTGDQLALPAPTDNKAGDVEEPKTPTNTPAKEILKTLESALDAAEGTGEPEKPTDPAMEALKIRILREVTASGSVNNKVESVEKVEKAERKVGGKAKRADMSNSSVEASPELVKPPKKKGGAGKKNTSKKKDF